MQETNLDEITFMHGNKGFREASLRAIMDKIQEMKKFYKLEGPGQHLLTQAFQDIYCLHKLESEENACKYLGIAEEYM